MNSKDAPARPLRRAAPQTDAAPRAPLREALVDAACDLLEEGGREALTLRRCAARAGVSHAAPAHHFDGLPGLLEAVAARGFADFADALEGAMDAGPDEPRARLKALMQGYLAFARDHSGLFDVMFRKAGRPNFMDPELRGAALRAWNALTGACAPFARDERQTRTIAMQVWSLAHGYAYLVGAGQADADAPDGSGFDAVMTLLEQIGRGPRV